MLSMVREFLLWRRFFFKTINMERTLIVAEIGECFNGSLARADKIMRCAKKAGCDIAKFQTLDYEAISETDPEKGWFKKIALDPKKIDWLIKDARKIGIGILFTPENEKTARWLLDLGCKDVKIASSCVTDIRLINFVNRNFKRVFLSTGMASINEVKRAVKALNKITDLFIMHCVSEYPTGPLLEKRGLRALADNDVKLNMMKILMGLFPGYKIGYSDHTSGILAPLLAVAAGAKVIEKHVTLDREAPVNNFKHSGKYLGTDHILSVEPRELRQMVQQIRTAETILGENKWQRSQGEKILRDFLRKRFKDNG